jgi:hypothetical protein
MPANGIEEEIMASVLRRDRSIHQITVEHSDQVTLGQLRELVAKSAGMPDRSSVFFGTGRNPSTTARSILVDYEGELEVNDER